MRNLMQRLRRGGTSGETFSQRLTYFNGLLPNYLSHRRPQRTLRQREGAEATEVKELAATMKICVGLSCVFFCQLLFKRYVFVFFVSSCARYLGNSSLRYVP